jgi:uncharacterized protein YbaR (Trm112 family)
MRPLLLGFFLLIALGTGGWTVYHQFKAPETSLQVGEEPEEITYICTETQEISKGEWQDTPATNPKTGRRTLMQALYCHQCKKWYPAPPPEMARQSPRGPVCPKDGQTLHLTDDPEDLEEE